MIQVTAIKLFFLFLTLQLKKSYNSNKEITRRFNNIWMINRN
jgi:hypothetical protein